jgi:chloride channel protein, CIC family
MNKFGQVLKIEFYKVASAVLLVGFGAGVFSFLLHKSVHSFSAMVGTLSQFTVQTYIFAIILSVGSYLLTKFLFNHTNGSGIPFVKLGLIALKGKMPRRMPFGKFLTTFLTLSSGLSFGKEGPLVTISASWGHLVAHIFKLNREITKVLVASGATAGLAAAFNTPIAAVVFTVEEILGQLNTKYLGPIIFTSVIASVTSYELLGNKATFIPVHYQFTEKWHLILYLSLGLVMSILGNLWTKLIIFFKDLKKNYFGNLDFAFIIFAIILTGIASRYSTEILGDGINTINRILMGKGEMVVSSIAALFILKIILSTTAYSTGLSGGLFMPVLFLGAVGGALFALGLKELGVENIEVGAFALLGMTSFLVAVIRAPFTAFVMLFEMTRDYELILPMMVSSIGAYWISTLLNPESVYETVAEYEGVHIPGHADNECLSEMNVEECMVKDVLSFREAAPIKDIIEQVNLCKFGGFPVVRGKKLAGIVNRYDLQKKLEEGDDFIVKNVTKTSVITIYPDQSLLIALDKMKRFQIGRLPVVSRFNDKQLLGVLTPEDIVKFLRPKK